MPKPRALVFYAFILFFFFIAFQQNVTNHTMQQYGYLADSFLNGKLHFLEKPGTWIDVVEYKNHLYWHMGPGPAVVLMPFMAVFRALDDFFTWDIYKSF